MTARFDVAIAGAGPAGAAAAIALARAGVRTALIGPQGPAGRAPRVGESVPADLRPELEALDAWSSFARAPHLASRGTAASWGGAALRFRDAFCSLQGGGWQLDRERFDATLVAEAERHGARLLAECQVVGAARSAGAWSVRLAHRQGGASEIAAGFLVDATGRHAAVARRCGAMRRRLDRLVGVGALVACPASDPPAEPAERHQAARHPLGRHLLVEAAEDGWWYAAWLPGGRTMVCWMSDSDLVRRSDCHRAAAWDARLARSSHLREALAGAARVSPVAVVPAASHCLTRCTGDGWLATGDAAAAFDPLSSAGIVLALRSGREAADAAARRLGGETAALAGYEDRIVDRYARYLSGRREIYATEARWPGAEFWRRRQAPNRAAA